LIAGKSPKYTPGFGDRRKSRKSLYFLIPDKNLGIAN
jgi:hypothetical protein